MPIRWGEHALADVVGDEASPLSLLDVVPTGIVALDGSGTAFYANNAARRLLGGDGQAGTLAEQWQRFVGSSVSRHPDVHLHATSVSDDDGALSYSVVVLVEACDHELSAAHADAQGYRLLFEASPNPMWVYDRESLRFLAVNDAAVRQYGYTREQFLSMSITDVRVIGDDDAVLRELEQLSPDASGLAGAWTHRTRDGTVINVEVTSQPLAFDDRSARVVLATDITERRRAERERKRLTESLRLLLDASAEGIYGLDPRGNCTFTNPAAASMFGYQPSELIGQPMHALIHHSYPDGSPYPVECCPIHNTLETGEPASIDLEVLWRRDGTCFPAEYRAHALVQDGAISGVVVNVSDISERARAEAQLAHQALHDALTDLPNRTLLEDRLARALARAARTGARVGVVFLDLDRFKLVNDSRGHAAGDRLLVAVAERLREAVRQSDTVARFGGDEFVVLFEGVASDAEARVLGERLTRRLDEPFLVGEQEIFVTASAGIVVGGSGDSAETMLQDADAAMYQAKERGRARAETFDATLRARANLRLATEAGLRRALERDEFHLVYQPMVSLDDGQVVGVEALLRWEHPTRGVVSPAEFIPLAEESGLIVPIGAWVLQRACRQFARWQEGRAGKPPLNLSVNLSARQLVSPDLLDVVRSSIVGAGLDPTTLTLELTESALMEDLGYLIQSLVSLRAVGVRLAIDDFGTGYSSLSYLKRLPIDTLKIDRSFIDGLGSDPHDSAIVEAVVAMGGALKLDVLAEGVETAEQRDCLRRLGCQFGQGYYFARPLPAHAVAQFVEGGAL